MKTLLFTGLAGILAVAPGTAMAALDSASDRVTPPSVDIAFASSTALASPAAGTNTMPRMGNMGHVPGMKSMGNMQRLKDFHHAGSHVRRGRMGYDKAYRKPHRGFRLPRTFIRPSYFIGNFGNYGLSQPNYGYGWSRYYDDAVLTDRYGVVQDARYNVDWDRYNQGYASLPRPMAMARNLPIRAIGTAPIGKTAAIRANGRAPIATPMAGSTKANILARSSGMPI